MKVLFGKLNVGDEFTSDALCYKGTEGGRFMKVCDRTGSKYRNAVFLEGEDKGELASFSPDEYVDDGKPEPQLTFGDLKVGETFLYHDGCHKFDTLYMKIQKIDVCNVVCLVEGPTDRNWKGTTGRLDNHDKVKRAEEKE